MYKYVYKNAVIYITKPTEEQKENIRKATERFVTRLAKEGFIGNDNTKRNYRRTGITNNYARERDPKVKEKDSTDQTIHRNL